MNFLFLILLLCFFIFLYIVYVLSHDDFVILRSNAPMEKIFNVAFLSAFFALFSARFFYVFLNPKPVFLSPLGFLLFPYFPGLSLMGGILGGFLVSAFILKNWNLPTWRILDFFSMAFLVSFPFGFLGSYLLSQNRISSLFYFSLILYLALLFVFVKFVLPRSLGGKLRDGRLSLLFVASFSISYFFSNLMFEISLTYENILAIIIFLCFSVVLIRKEDLIERFISIVKNLAQKQ